MALVQNTKDAEITQQDALLLTRNLLRIAINNICYIRVLFHEKYFSDKSVPKLEMKIKKLMPMDAESRRLIDWMEKGVYDALQKKYLKTLLFCICEKEEGPMIEEYSFSFSYPNTSMEEIVMNMSRTGSKKGSTAFTSNASEVTPDQMRSSACKMIRTLVSLMKTLDPMPEEPEDYEPPFFKCCADNEAINIWNKNPLKMEVGNVNSKHLVLALKVKSVLGPCDDSIVNSGDDGMRMDNESGLNDDFSDTEVRPSEADRYVVAPNDRKFKGQSTGAISEDDTQDAAHEEQLTAEVKEICSREMGTINVSDVLCNFPDISMEMVEGNAGNGFCLQEIKSDIMERLLKDGVISRASKDGYTVNQAVDPKTPHIKKEIITQNVSPTEGTKQNNGDLIYMKALYHALPMDYVTIAKLNGKLGGEANQNTVRKFIDKMVQDGYVKNSANRRLGKAVIHSESSNRKLLEIKRILEGNEGEQMAIDTNTEHVESERKDLLKAKAHEMRDGSTMGCLQSVRSDLTRTRELPELHQNVSMQSGQDASAMDKDPSRTPTSVREPIVPVCSLESGVLGQKIKMSLIDGNEMQSTQDKRSRKASMVGRILCINPKPSANYWNLDSGATNHICGSRSWVKEKRKIAAEDHKEFFNAANKRVKFNEIGNILSQRLRLYNVYISEDIEELELYISIGQMTKEGYSICIGDRGEFSIHLAQNFNHIVGRGSLDKNRQAYLVKFFNDSVLDRGTPLELLEREVGKEAEGAWVLGSGCPYHITNNKSFLTSQRPLREVKTLDVVGNGKAKSKLQGNVSIPNIELSKVYFCAAFKDNLVYVLQLNAIGYRFHFYSNMCYVTYKDDVDNLVGLAHRDPENNNYYVEYLQSK